MEGQMIRELLDDAAYAVATGASLWLVFDALTAWSAPMRTVLGLLGG